MVSHTFVQQVKVVTGKGCIQQLGELLQQSGYQKAFLVFDAGIAKAGVIERITLILKQAEIEFVEYGKVLPDPPAEIVDEGAVLCKQEKCDCVIGIGGGSSIDTAKGINILRFNEGCILDYTQKEMKLCSGLITVPTTSGTGSELSNGAIISDVKNDTKAPILCFNNMSEYTILDPELTVGMPYGLTLMTGLDAFSHAAESYTSVNANPMTDFICEKAMQEVVENLPTVLKEPGNLQAREKMQCTASIGGWMLYSASAHVGHSVAHVLGAHFHMVHGAVCAYTLPTVLQKLALVVPEKVKYIGKLLGVEFKGNEDSKMIGRMTAEAYRAFVQALGLQPMEKIAVTEEVITKLASDIVNEPLAGFSPLKVDEALAKEILNEIFQ